MARADRDAMRAAFDALAEGWDETHGPGSANGAVFAACLAHLRQACGRRPRPRVLDVGCGTGMHLRNLADLVEEGVGIDLSPAMVERARAASTADGRLRFVVCPAEEVSAQVLDRFDVVLVVGALEHLADPGRALAAMASILAPAGEIVVVMRHPWRLGAVARRLVRPVSRTPPYRHLTPRQLGRLAETAGLRLAAVFSLECAGRPYAAHLTAVQG